MRDRLSDYQEEYGELYNLEATPAESTSYRLAKHDRAKWPDIKTAGKDGDTPYYTNSSHLPVDYTSDIFDALDIQDELQTLYTSGTVFHAFLGEKLPDWKAAASLVRKIAENYRLPYYTLSPTYSVCSDHGYIAGEHFTCPVCGHPAEVYSRITGYYRPVQNLERRQAAGIQKQDGISAGDLCAEKRRLTAGENRQRAGEHGRDDGGFRGRQYQVPVHHQCLPNCKIAKQMLEGEEYEVIDAEAHPDMAAALVSCRRLPWWCWTGDEMKKYVNASNIQKFVEHLSQ